MRRVLVDDPRLAGNPFQNETTVPHLFVRTRPPVMTISMADILASATAGTAQPLQPLRLASEDTPCSQRGHDTPLSVLPSRDGVRRAPERSYAALT